MRHIQKRSALLLGLLVVLAVPLLAGCRAEEQNRITMYEPGEYMGAKHNSLSQAQVRALRHRATGQSGATKPVGGGSGSGSISVGDVDTGMLDQRTTNQGGS